MEQPVPRSCTISFAHSLLPLPRCHALVCREPGIKQGRTGQFAIHLSRSFSGPYINRWRCRAKRKQPVLASTRCAVPRAGLPTPPQPSTLAPPLCKPAPQGLCARGRGAARNPSARNLSDSSPLGEEEPLPAAAVRQRGVCARAVCAADTPSAPAALPLRPGSHSRCWPGLSCVDRGGLTSVKARLGVTASQ